MTQQAHKQACHPLRGRGLSQATRPHDPQSSTFWIYSRFRVQVKLLLRHYGGVKGEAVHLLRALAARRGCGGRVRGRAREERVSERGVLARRGGRGLREMLADRTVSDVFLVPLMIPL